jgi:hypothetical protein
MDGHDSDERWTPRQRRFTVFGDGSSGISGDDDRVSDAEREVVLAEVRRQTVSGRLSIAEFSERTHEALTARTAGELRAALRGLPQPAARGPRPSRRGRPVRLGPLVALLIVLAVIGVTGGHGWILFPLFWLWFGLLRPRRWAHHRYSLDALTPRGGGDA